MYHLLLLLFAVGAVAVPTLECDACQAVFSFVEANTTVDEIVAVIDDVCADLPAGTRKNDCYAVAAKAHTLYPALLHFLDRRTLTPLHLCAWLEIACEVDCCQSPVLPEQPRLLYTAVETSVYVQWITAVTAATPQFVEYGLNSSSLSNRAFATASSYHSGLWVGTIYTAEVTGLVAGAPFWYRVGSRGAQSEVLVGYPLRGSGGDPTAELRVCFIADMGSTAESDPTVATVTRMSNAGAFDFVLHVGDIGYADGVESIWDTYGRKIAPYASRIPIIAAPGNHEIIYNFTAYKSRYPAYVSDTAGNDGAMYHSETIGPVHFVGISSELWDNTGYLSPEQLTWIEQDLKQAGAVKAKSRAAAQAAVEAAVSARAANAALPPLTHAELESVAARGASGPTWTIAYLHRPLYCSSPGGWPGPPTTDPDDDCYGTAQYLRDRLESMFNTYGVDMVLSGHVHNTERTFPICFDGSTHTVLNNSASEGPWAAKCPVYVVAGAPGNREGLQHHYLALPDWSVQQSRVARLSFGAFNVTARSLSYASISSEDGQSWDTFVLRSVTEV